MQVRCAANCCNSLQMRMARSSVELLYKAWWSAVYICSFAKAYAAALVLPKRWQLQGLCAIRNASWASAAREGMQQTACLLCAVGSQHVDEVASLWAFLGRPGGPKLTTLHLIFAHNTIPISSLLQQVDSVPAGERILTLRLQPGQQQGQRQGSHSWQSGCRPEEGWRYLGPPASWP